MNGAQKGGLVLAAALLFALALAVVRSLPEKIVIADAAKPQRLVFKSSRPVSSMALKVSGAVDGAATIERAYTDERRMYGPQRIGPGPVSFKTGEDWYGQECIVFYEPGAAKSGRLTVEIEFR